LKSRWLWLLLLGGVLLSSSQVWAAEDDPVGGRDICLMEPLCHQLYKRARTLSRAGALDRAAVIYREAYERRPAVWLLLNLGRILHRQGKLEEAIENYQRYLELSQGNDEARIEKARQFLLQAQQELAQKQKSSPPAASPPPKSPLPESAEAEAGEPVVLKAAPSERASDKAPAASSATSEQPALQPVPRKKEPEPVQTAALLPPPPAAPPPPADQGRRWRQRLDRSFWIGLGASGAGFAAAAITGSLALSGASELQGSLFVGAPSEELLALQQRTRALAISTDVLLAASAAALLTVVIVTFTKKVPSRPSGRAELRPAAFSRIGWSLEPAR